jgi:hypothetical protein
VSQLTVGFAASRPPRSGPLAFGHANIVRAITLDDDPTRLTLAMVFDVPAGSDLQTVALNLAALVERHDALRTSYEPSTPPVQHVAAAGEFVLDVVAAEAGEDALDLAEATARRLRSRIFDLGKEAPFRAAVVTVDGEPRHLVWVVSHAAMDVAACEVFHAEWSALAAGRELPPSPELEPLDVVELEQTSSVRRLAESAVRYWESSLRRVPQATFVQPIAAPAKTDWRHPGLTIRSHAAPAQLAAVAERTETSPSAVALAALALLVQHRVALDTVAITSIAGNRVVRKLRGFFGSLAQDALLPLEIGGPNGVSGFDDVVRRTQAATLPAYRTSWFDPTAVWQGIDRVSTERGISFARDLVFNDMSALAAASGSPEEAARGRLPGVWIPGHQEPLVEEPGLGGGISWQPAEDIPCRFFACLYRITGEFELTVWVDPQSLDRAEAEEFGRAYLRLLAAAAEADLPLGELARLTDLAPVEYGDGWVLADGNRVELAAVRALMNEALDGAPCLITAVDDAELGHRIICHLADADPAQAHQRALAVLPGRTSALAPHGYVVHEAVPEPGRASDPAAWAELPVRAESTGRTSALAPDGDVVREAVPEPERIGDQAAWTELPVRAESSGRIPSNDEDGQS